MQRVLGFACGVGVILMGIALGGELTQFIDYPSLVLTIGGAFAFCFSVHAPGDLWQAFKVANATDPVTAADFHRHDAVLSTFSNTTIASGAAGNLIGMVNMLANLERIPKHWSACAVAILTLLYAAIVSGLIITPLRGRMKSRIAEGPSRTNDPSAAVPTALIFLILVVVMVALPLVFN